MAKIVFHEAYGELTYAQRAAYRKYNVSPSDHDMLVEACGEGDHDRIVEYVKAYSVNGMFSWFNMRQAMEAQRFG